ncbi:hypothetical protein I4F81_003223 [Pyropia yezoensis]|uniref:Uncharacterized protein n=1 Tax=Pyropia yezoensis TaxID=2788 RepID=A0ACC3BRS8_PYRYE|nr:hypothetical protein I4F81_003223 [Neopyropia yezoensis]
MARPSAAGGVSGGGGGVGCVCSNRAEAADSAGQPTGTAATEPGRGGGARAPVPPRRPAYGHAAARTMACGVAPVAAAAPPAREGGGGRAAAVQYTPRQPASTAAGRHGRGGGGSWQPRRRRPR